MYRSSADRISQIDGNNCLLVKQIVSKKSIYVSIYKLIADFNNWNWVWRQIR